VFVFMLAAAGLSALLFGLAPAIQATRSNVMQAARGEFASDFRASRLRDVLVIGQVAVSVLLLIFAATLLRANHRLRGLDVGLRTAGVIELNTPDRHRAKVIRELVSQPGVQSLAAASKVPFEGSLPRIPVSPEHGELYPAGYLYTSPEYFSIFQVPIQRGRAFTREEAVAGSAVAVVSQSTAQRLWGTRDPLGQTLRLAPNPRQAPSLADPRTGLDERRVEVDGLVERARRTFRHRLDRGEDDLVHQVARIRALSPLATLRRGYAVLSDAEGQALSSVATLEPGQDIHIRVGDGRIGATTTSVDRIGLVNDPHDSDHESSEDDQ